MAQAQSPSQSGDAVKLDPKHYEVEYENDRFRVLRVKYGPNEKSVMHRHPAGVVIVLSDCDFRTYLPQGKERTIIGRRGQVIGFDKPFEHLPENLSTKPFEAIFVEVKEPQDGE
jgi:quercetin dioxygenase-like cupin family protein